MQTLTFEVMNVNRFGQSLWELQTVVLRGKSSTAYNIRLKEILKRRALFGNQTVVLLTGSGALTNSGASNPFFVMRHAWATSELQTDCKKFSLTNEKINNRNNSLHNL